MSKPCSQCFSRHAFSAHPMDAKTPFAQHRQRLLPRSEPEFSMEAWKKNGNVLKDTQKKQKVKGKGDFFVARFQ